MNRETDPRDGAPKENILVVEDNGRIVSRRVSQVYGRALLGAMALRINSLPFRHLHDSFFPQIELLTLDKIRRTAQAVAPRDNFMFIDASRRILSCQVNPDYGVALLESLQQTLEDASHTQSVSSRATVTQASETSSNPRDTIAESSQCASKDFVQPYPNTPYSPLSTSETLANSAGILSDQILSFANRQPYDRDWMSKYSINESCLNGPLSKHKLDVLVRYGAVKMGDRLCVTYHLDDGPVVKIGEVLHSVKTGRLDLRIAPAREDFDGILHDCKGAKDIVGGIDKEFQIKRHSKLSGAWKMVAVVSEDGRDIGSLWKVRQAYQVFTEIMIEWGIRNRQGSH